MIVSIVDNKLVMSKTIDNYYESPLSIKHIDNNLFVVRSEHSIQLLHNHTLIPIILLN
jgi:hypothetical protein